MNAPEANGQSDRIGELSKLVSAFRDERGWSDFNTPRDNVLSLFIEVAELAELVRWKEASELDKGKMSAELADIFYWLLLISNDLGIDLAKSLQFKMEENRAKYPVDKAFRNPKKYDELV